MKQRITKQQRRRVAAAFRRLAPRDWRKGGIREDDRLLSRERPVLGRAAWI